MFYFGLDWGQYHHELCICNEQGSTLSRLRLEHSVAGFQKLETERAKLQVPAKECLVGIETAHNLLVDFLLEQEYVVYIIPPKAMDGYRNRYRFQIVLAGFIAVLVLTNRLPGRSGQVAWLRLAVLAS